MSDADDVMKWDLPTTDEEAKDLAREDPDGHGPTRVVMTIDPQEGTVRWSTRHPDDDAVPASVWHGRVTEIRHPPLTPEGYEIVRDDLSDAVDRYAAGHNVVWDRSNHVGQVTPDARAALREIRNYTDRMYLMDRVLEAVPVGEVVLDDGVADALRWLREDVGVRIDAGTSDEDLRNMVPTVRDAAKWYLEPHQVLTGDLYEVLQHVRNEADTPEVGA